MGAASTNTMPKKRIELQKRLVSCAASAEVNSPVCSLKSTVNSVRPSRSKIKSASSPRACHFSSPNQYGRAICQKRCQSLRSKFFARLALRGDTFTDLGALSVGRPLQRRRQQSVCQLSQSSVFGSSESVAHG